MVPLIVFSILLALAILRVPPATREPLAAFFKSLCAAMLVLVRWVVALAPIGVFALVLPLAAHLGASVAGAIGLYIAAYSVACVAVTLLLYPVAVIVARVPLRRFARAALPAFSWALRVAAALVESAERGPPFPNQIASSRCRCSRSRASVVDRPRSSGWFYGIPLHASGWRPCVCRGVSRVCRAGIPARSHARAALSGDQLPVEGSAFSSRWTRSRHVRDGLGVTGDLVAAALVNRFSPRSRSAVHPLGAFMSSVNAVVLLGPISTDRSSSWYPCLVIFNKELPSGRKIRLTVPVAVVVT
jgi:hypothetical protein